MSMTRLKLVECGANEYGNIYIFVVYLVDF